MQSESGHEAYFREQLSEATVNQLLGLDLANNPDAQIPLLTFLDEMDVPLEKIVDSKIFRTLQARRNFEQLLRDNGLEKLLSATGIN